MPSEKEEKKRANHPTTPPDRVHVCMDEDICSSEASLEASEGSQLVYSLSPSPVLHTRALHETAHAVGPHKQHRHHRHHRHAKVEAEIESDIGIGHMSPLIEPMVETQLRDMTPSPPIAITPPLLPHRDVTPMDVTPPSHAHQRRRLSTPADMAAPSSQKRTSSSDGGHAVAVVAQGWTRRIAERVTEIRDESMFLSDAHSRCGYHFTKRQRLLALPAIITPAVCSPIVALLASGESSACDDEPSPYGIAPSTIVGTVSLAVTSALTTVMSQLKWGDRARDHNVFAAKYSDLATTITTELARSRRFRRNVDQFLVECQMRFDSYCASEPVIPLKIRQLVTKESTMRSRIAM